MSLGPVKVNLGLNKTAIKYIAKQTHYTYEQVENLIISLVSQALDMILLDLRIWIDIHVPKRTGQLRESLKAVLRTSQVVGNVAKIVLATAIEYAQRVNEMTTGQVRHYHTTREHSGRKAYAYGMPVILDDPRAEGHFFDKLTDFAYERALVNLTKLKYKFSTSSFLTLRQLSKVGVY